MITLKTDQVLSLKKVLEHIIQQSEKNPLSFSLNVKLTRIIDKCQEALLDYQKRNNKNIKELGEEIFEKDDNGNIIMIEEIHNYKVDEDLQVGDISFEENGINKVKRMIPKSNGEFEILPIHKNWEEYLKRTEMLLNENVEILNVFPFEEKELDELKIPLNMMPGIMPLLKEVKEEKKTKK